MTDVGGGEYRLTDRPKRLPHINPCRRGGSSIARWEWSMQVACSCTPSRQDSCEDVIFMSGLADEGAFWDDQVAGLRDRWRITTFDNRGVGRSETPPGEYRTTSFAADTIAFMESLGIEHAHVVGSSMGGAIALGHPLGASGARLLTTLLHELERSNTELGLVAMCCRGGIGTGTVIQRV